MSWYDKLQPTALLRNNQDVTRWKYKGINKIYKLSEYTCNQSCKVGSPKPKCLDGGYAMGWTYDEPCKCACWSLQYIYQKEILDK